MGRLAGAPRTRRSPLCPLRNPGMTGLDRSAGSRTSLTSKRGAKMERIVVGQTQLPSGRPIEQLFLITQPRAPAAPKQLHANDGTTVYMRFYPQYPDRPDV